MLVRNGEQKKVKFNFGVTSYNFIRNSRNKRSCTLAAKMDPLVLPLAQNWSSNKAHPGISVTRSETREQGICFDVLCFVAWKYTSVT